MTNTLYEIANFLYPTNIVTSFCRKTTLTKHSRRTHKIGVIGNDISDDDSSDSDSSITPSRQSAVRNKSSRTNSSSSKVHKSTGSNSLNNLSNDGRMMSQDLALELQVLTNLQQSRPRSSRSSVSSGVFSTVTTCSPQLHGLPLQPPTPRSPFYGNDFEFQDRLPMYHSMSRNSTLDGLDQASLLQVTEAGSAFDDTIRITCNQQNTQALLAAAQAIQGSSPGGLSSCSSVTSQHSADYFYRNPGSYSQSPAMYSLMAPVSPGTIVYPVHGYAPQISVSAPPAGMHGSALAAPVLQTSQLQPALWYDYQFAHQQQTLGATLQNRMFYSDQQGIDITYMKHNQEPLIQ